MEYENTNNIAVVTIDDGKANVVGHGFLDHINSCLDRAEQENAGAVVLRGREGIFSAGFDLEEFKKGPEAGLAMVKRGFELLIRLYRLPMPLVAACTGHSIAMGAFIVMACDMRVGINGPFKMRLPETAIGMELPAILLALTESRISDHHMTRVALLSEAYDPVHAVEAGFIDETVDAQKLEARSMEIAEQLAQLPQSQFAANKLAIRASTLLTMQESLDKMIQK